MLGQGEGLDRVIAGPEEADRHLPHLLQQRHVRERRRNQHEANDHRPVRRRKRDSLRVIAGMSMVCVRVCACVCTHALARARRARVCQVCRVCTWCACVFVCVCVALCAQRVFERLAAAPALPHDDGARRAAVVLGPDDVTHDLRHVLAGHRAWLGELVRVQVRDNDAPTGTREESRRRNPLGDHVGIRALALQRDDEWRASRAELECIDATEVGGEFQRDGLAGRRGH